MDDLRAPLDEEERSRIEVEDDYTLIIVDTPILEERGEKDWYGTIPLSIIVTDEVIITVLPGGHFRFWADLWTEGCGISTHNEDPVYPSDPL